MSRLRQLGVFLFALFLCGPGCEPDLDPPIARRSEAMDTLIMTAEGVGPIRLGMTLEEARAAVPAARFARTSDGEGLALIEMTVNGQRGLTLYADERNASAPIDFRRKIEFIEVRDPAFHTAEVIHPGSLVAEVVQTYGPVRMILMSEIEQREFLEIEGAPEWLTLRIGPGAIYPPGDRATAQYAPDTKILSMSIAHFQEQPPRGSGGS